MSDINTMTVDIFTARNKLKELLKGTAGIQGYGIDFKSNTIVIYVDKETTKQVCESKLAYLGEFHCGRFTRRYYVQEGIHFS